MLTITEPEEGEEEEEGKHQKKSKKRVVMVMARQHPGESPASYVVQGRGLNVIISLLLFIYHCLSGLIDFLVSKHKIASQLRQKLIFKVSLAQ